MQSTLQELHYGAGIINNVKTESYRIQYQTADGLQALATSIVDDRHAVTNLSHTNVLLNDQVANLSKKVTSQDTEIDKLYKSISDLTVTIRTFADNISSSGQGSGRGRSGGRGGQKKMPEKQKKEQKYFSIHYCWTHRITGGPQHTRLNCANQVEGHHCEATLFNRMNGSMKGIRS
eukprot:3120104-Ditylum_brightwellii.AAC.1